MLQGAAAFSSTIWGNAWTAYFVKCRNSANNGPPYAANCDNDGWTLDLKVSLSSVTLIEKNACKIPSPITCVNQGCGRDEELLPSEDQIPPGIICRTCPPGKSSNVEELKCDPNVCTGGVRLPNGTIGIDSSCVSNGVHTGQDLAGCLTPKLYHKCPASLVALCVPDPQEAWSTCESVCSDGDCHRQCAQQATVVANGTTTEIECPFTVLCDIPMMTAEIQAAVSTYHPAECSVAGGMVSAGESCEFRVHSGYSCTAPGLCTSDGTFTASASCYGSWRPILDRSMCQAHRQLVLCGARCISGGRRGCDFWRSGLAPYGRGCASLSCKCCLCSIVAWGA